jgi:hypothetical protein
MKIYLAGPMQGIPEFNFPAFNAMAHGLRQSGNEVFNPAERDIERHGGVDISKGNTAGSLDHAVTEHKFSLRDALRDDCTYICDHAEAIVLLPGWENSKGAQAEHRLAVALGLELIYTTPELVDLMKRAHAVQQQLASGDVAVEGQAVG